LPSNTAFRGFGGPQAMFVIESALHAAARALGVTTGELQRRNLLRAGDALPYGTTLQTPTLPQCWAEAEARFDVPARRREIAAFNGTHRWEKRGLALMPVCFGISFTTTFLNQAGALVHVFSDGSVAVSTAAVEMGQGTKAKLRSVAALALGIRPERVRLDTTTTSRIANTSPTAASSGPDLNGHATQLACHAVLARLKEFAARQLGAAAEAIELREEQVCLAGRATDWDWLKLVSTAYLHRVNLSAHAHYATPEIHFDKATNQGHPFAYHAVGVAVVEATVDCLRGTGRVDAVRVVHDAGRSLDALVDRGQIEGGVLQGIGWMTMEECRHDASGRLLTDTLTTYKVPGLNDAPGEFEIHFLENSVGPAGIRGSKTVGEPPLMYGIGAYFALLEAMRAARPELNPFYAAPLTAERILMALEGAASCCTAQEAPADNAPATP
jgi:xanthine dehydrogenase large subunit